MTYEVLYCKTVPWLGAYMLFRLLMRKALVLFLDLWKIRHDLHCDETGG